MVYQGTFDGEFELEAKQFIIRDNDEIAFLLNGSDEWGAFSIEGVAKKTEHGFYMAPLLKLEYPQYNSDDKASIKIDYVEFTPKKNRCRVNLTWIQSDESYPLSGSLTRKSK